MYELLFLFLKIVMLAGTGVSVAYILHRNYYGLNIMEEKLYTIKGMLPQLKVDITQIVPRVHKNESDLDLCKKRINEISEICATLSDRIESHKNKTVKKSFKGEIPK